MYNCKITSVRWVQIALNLGLSSEINLKMNGLCKRLQKFMQHIGDDEKTWIKRVWEVIDPIYLTNLPKMLKLSIRSDMWISL